MKYNIPCEVVQDLLPSYIEELTSPETNEYVKEHLAGCEECHEIYEAMKPQPEEVVEVPQVKEIDYLKNVKKKNHRSVISAIALCTILALGWIFGSPYVKGTAMKADQVSYDYEVSDQRIKLWAASTEAGYCIKEIKVEEVEPGVLEYAFANVKESPWSKQCVGSEYDASAPITQIRMDGIVIWNQDRVISRITSEVYNSRHPYVGDMPANGTTASALNVQHYLGNYTVELETANKPYVWNLNMSSTYSSLRRKNMEARMRGYAYAMLAVIDNLDVVRFNYVIDDQGQCALEVTTEEATEFAGKDIKEVGQNLNLLEEMMEKAGLTEEHYFVDEVNRLEAAENTIVLNLINLTEEELGSIAIDCYTGTGKDRKLVSTACGMNANEAKIKRGVNFKYVLAPEDFGLQRFGEADNLSVELAVTDEIASNDAKYLYFQVDTPVNLTPETVENVTLMGDFVNGIRIQP